MALAPTDSVDAGQALGAWSIRLHMRLYRAACYPIEKIAVAVFDRASPLLQTGWNFARKLSVIDYAYTGSLRAINSIALKTIHEPAFEEESMKTLGQIKREREIREMLEGFDKGSSIPKFCKVAADYISESIPRVVGERLEGVPRFSEGLLLYQLGLSVRYVNRQLNKKLGLRDAAISSKAGHWLQTYYGGYRTRIAHALVGRHNIEPLVGFEHLLLKIASKLNRPGKPEQNAKLVSIGVRVLAEALAQQDGIDTYLDSLPLRSSEQRMIARLEWHKKNGSLPAGLPDPQKERLTPANLEEKLEEHLYQYVEGIVGKLLKRVAPPNLKRGLLGALYFLEGEDALRSLLTYLIAEFGINQLVDPHRFALAILYASGTEVAEYELDGFGRGENKRVLKTGRSVLRSSLQSPANWREMRAIYADSGLKYAPAGLEGLLQKHEAKLHLKQYIATTIHDMIKGDKFRHDLGMVKTLRRQVDQLPVVGMATISLHMLISGTFFSFGYLFRDHQESNTSFLTWLFKHLSGRDLCNFLADRIVELIYHPSWRITLLQVIEAMVEQVEHPHRDQAPVKLSDFNKITGFVFQHFRKESQAFYDGGIPALFDYFAGEQAFEMFKNFLQSSGNSFLEKALGSLTPTIMELMLYTRVVDAFRQENVSWEGDAKFWEVFIREALNEFVEEATRHRFGPLRSSSVAISNGFRDRFVDVLLAMDTPALKRALLDPPELDNWLADWELMPKKVEPVEVKAKQFNLVDMLIDDYDPSKSKVE